jgi:catechol 2,3-dioxygenase-like lactoylglutathione lyase family enzyme
MITEIVHVPLIVREYEEAKSFYCDNLGFIIAEDTLLSSGKRWVRLRARPRITLHFGAQIGVRFE